MPEPAGPAGGPERAASPPHRRRARIDRRPVLAVVAAVVVVGVLAGRGNSALRPAGAAVDGGPQVAPASALTSSWFCAGATDSPGGAAPGNLVIANDGTQAVSGTATVVGDTGTRASVAVSVPAAGRVVVPEAVPGGAGWVGAFVDLNGGRVAVEEQVTAPLGITAEPCATAGSTSWYFANGATLVNATSTVSLLNPYSSPAIVGLTFTTNEGVEEPSAFQGIYVPAHGIVAVDLGSHLRRRTAIATTVTAVAGRVVAWKTDVVTQPAAGTPLLGTAAAHRANADPASPYAGLTETLGAPARSTRWYWPEGGSSAGVSDRYVVYNPGPGTAELRLAFDLDQGSAEPYTLSLGPDDVVSIDTGSSARIPTGVGYSAVLRATNGVGVVAERVVDAAAPATLAGTAEVLGATTPAAHWLIPAGHAGARLEESVVVANPGSAPVTVEAQALVDGHVQDIPGLGPATLGPGRRLVWNLGSHSANFAAAVVVRASGPVVVGRDLIGLGRRHGIGLALGIPEP